MELEVWLPVPGFPDYAVSNPGQVMRTTRGFGTWPGRILRSHPTTKDRLAVVLAYEGKRKTMRVATLVALAFMGKPKRGQQINHLDGNHRNDNASNLEYCTLRENMEHARRLKLWPRGDNHCSSKLNSVKVRIIRRGLQQGLRPKYLAERFQTTRDNIYNIKWGRTWKHLLTELEKGK